MYSINYGGFYCINNPLRIGKIYLRFFRSGKIAYSIRSDIKENENIFDLLQKNYNKNIDLVNYHMGNGNIDLEINTNIGLLQLSGKINNDSIIFNITNVTTKTSVANDMIFSYFKKEYIYCRDHKKINNIQIKNSKNLKLRKIYCKNCHGTEFENYILFNENDEFIGFICKICKTAYIYENNSINVLGNIKKEKKNNDDFEENIPGSPKMARSFNGISYRSIAKWGKNL